MVGAAIETAATATRPDHRLSGSVHGLVGTKRYARVRPPGCGTLPNGWAGRREVRLAVPRPFLPPLPAM